MLSRGRVTREVERFSSGRDPSNWISVVLTEVSFISLIEGFVRSH